MSREEVRESAGALHGWGFTPTGDPPPNSTVSNDQPKGKCLPEIITKGWKRTTLYAILVLLMILIFLNIALTLWIISALRLSMVREKHYFINKSVYFDAHCLTKIMFINSNKINMKSPWCIHKL